MQIVLCRIFDVMEPPELLTKMVSRFLIWLLRRRIGITSTQKDRMGLVLGFVLFSYLDL